jgi:hypothetical protein
MFGRWRCLMGLHKWARKLTLDNKPYEACVRCGVENTAGEGRSPGLP